MLCVLDGEVLMCYVLALQMMHVEGGPQHLSSKLHQWFVQLVRSRAESGSLTSPKNFSFQTKSYPIRSHKV